MVADLFFSSLPISPTAHTLKKGGAATDKRRGQVEKLVVGRREDGNTPFSN